jgi:soluble lytic murein transglycosylase
MSYNEIIEKIQKLSPGYRTVFNLFVIDGFKHEEIAKKLNIKDFSEEQLYDPALNIKFGAWYLADLSREFDNDLVTILAAYNAGRGKVNSWLKEWNAQYDEISDLPYSETRNYIRKVLKIYKYYEKLYEFK